MNLLFCERLRKSKKYNLISEIDNVLRCKSVLTAPLVNSTWNSFAFTPQYQPSDNISFKNILKMSDTKFYIVADDTFFSNVFTFFFLV